MTDVLFLVGEHGEAKAQASEKGFDGVATRHGQVGCGESQDPGMLGGECRDMVNKLIWDGKVAVMYSRGFGAGYLGGIEGLTLEWLPVGTRFRISEYDGAESVIWLEQEELTFSA